MKRIIFIASALASIIGWTACTNADAHYVELGSGKRIVVEKDEHGRMVNAETRQPVGFYVDTRTNDTIDGKTGHVVNGKITKKEDGEYVYMKEPETFPEGVEYKKKVDKDGDVKIKTEHGKIKIDGETGKKKVKED